MLFLARTEQAVSIIRFLSFFGVLILGCLAGYVSGAGLKLDEKWAKRAMNFVLLVLTAPIIFLVMWDVELKYHYIALPILGAVIMVLMSGVSYLLFRFQNLKHERQLTMTMAGGLSNMGYTGSSLICYIFFGAKGLGLCQIYLLSWSPIVFLVFFPMLKAAEHTRKTPEKNMNLLTFMDIRLIIIPVVLAALGFNLLGIPRPEFVEKLHLLDIMIYTASFLTFFAITLRVKFKRFKVYTALYFWIAGVKFLATPLLAVLLLWLVKAFGVDIGLLAEKVVLIQASAPVAVSMVTIANVFDLDARLGSALWVVNTVFYVVVVVPVLYIMFVL